MRRIHSRGFVHKDIKPDNILINKNDRAKVGDLGIALPHSEGEYLYTIAPPKFSAPELIFAMSSKGKYTKSVDVYSFGLLLNYLLTNTEHNLNLS